MRAAWAVWHGLLLLDALGLLAVAIYAALVSPDAGPGATPLLMAGLLSLCVIVLALISAVNAALWASVARSAWWLRLALIVLSAVGVAVVFQLAVYASDPGDPMGRWVGLGLFSVSIPAAYALNRHAISRYRRGRASS